MNNKRWHDLNAAQRRGVVAAGAVQAGLAAAAWYDLSHRPRDLVNGSKVFWALVIGINFAGPLAYFRFGRHHPLVHKATPWHEKVHMDTSAVTR